MARPKNRQTSLYFEYPHYAFDRPPEMEGKQTAYPVAIVGAGPVGVTAALELSRHGVASVVLDDKDTVNDGSRAICVARHSFEILQQLGLSDRFTAKALPWTHGTSFFKNQPVFRLEMPHSEQERFHPMYNIQQQYIEKFLIDKAIADDRIDLRWQSRLIGITQDDDAVHLTVATPEGEYPLEARYVLAADGARSTVRHLQNLALNGDAYEGRYVIVDVRMKSDYPTERRAFFDPPSNPGLTVLVHRQPDDIWRIDYQLAEGEDEQEAVREETIRARITSIVAMLGESGDWELEWWSVYKAYTLALDDYRHGRILFIGDAAHLVPIFGVRGLNSGFADAMNAAWKLAYVIHGWAQDRLLDSYSPERRGATLDVFDNAVKSTKFMTPPTRGYKLMRDAALSLALDDQFTQPLINPRQSVPYTYTDSSLTSFKDRDAEFDGGPGAGAPLVNRKLDGGGYLLDLLGPGFSGLFFTEEAVLSEEIKALFATLQVGEEAFTPIIVSKGSMRANSITVVTDPAGRIAAAYRAEEASFYLTRPDRHICARWKKICPAEVKQAFTQALGG
jgi:3-(3-hydroxy-phenyl)propionate hydroxylase